MTEIGHIALIMALPVAILAATASAIGARIGPGWPTTIARNSIYVLFGLFTLALAVIIYAFFTRDFSLRIVVEHVSRDLNAAYTLSALYADKAGSMFFWGWLVSLFTAVLAFQKQGFHRQVKYYALTILAVVQVFFIALITLVVNVFEKQPSPVAEGFGLNPLLQNFGMLVHPPLLYLGFAGFAVVFALSMAALITRRAGAEWGAVVRRWAIFAWCTLGVGNLLGMWWSYNELGWGGYWAWDPVENAGLMPWLVGTAFIHSMAMRRRRRYLVTWSRLLIVFTFALTLLSPFITHGGIESPLHGFYGSTFPPYILAAILITLVGSSWLLYRHRDSGNEEKPASLVSKEGAFLLTNVILVVLAFIILAGTVLPRVIEAVAGVRITLDRSFFDRTCGPVMLVLVFFTGVCPLLGWGKAVWSPAERNAGYFLLAVLVITIAILVFGIGNWYIAVMMVCSFPLFIVLQEWYRGTRARHRARGENHFLAFLFLIGSNRARYGGFLAHIGIILITLGIIVSSFYNIERTATLDIGETMNIGKYELTYDELIFRQDNVRARAIASLSASRNGRPVGVMQPSYDYWFRHDDHFAEVAVRSTPAEDLFVSLVWTGFDPGDKSATFRVLVNPLIVWMWVGGGFFLLGGAVAFLAEDRQLYRDRV
ncbi:MAG TPA: heme lyase CcmF/NrfE family subunit [Dehalococcoidia bacterium]|nr:heme lyase CcmF/NrfE family subunit [Dehalococcoidia bacterium]